jgi:hypothetical protein
MAGRKYDGVIEAVRYTSGGKISEVRVYERRGVVWSDRFLLDRQALIDRLKKGKRFVVGERKTYLGSVFATGAAVRCVGEHVVTDAQTASGDQLTGVAIF